jgi:Ca2+-transporting ATPase
MGPATAWYRDRAGDVARAFDVVPEHGLSAAEARRRRRTPRPVGAPVLSTRDWLRLCVQGAVMTIGSLIAFQIGGPFVGTTMLLTTLSLFHLAAGLLARDPHHTIFDRAALPGPAQLRRYGLALLMIVLVTSFGFLQRIFDTVGLSFAEWALCVSLAATLIVVDELVKLVSSRSRRPRWGVAGALAHHGRRADEP